MKLPDFAEFEPMLKLRAAMGAERLGKFDFFDPQRHLTADERLQLSSTGIEVQPEQLRKVLDHTIAYKNARVLVWQNSQALCGQFHLAWCEKFPRSGLCHVGACWPAGDNWRVCEACLDQLQYEGHNSHRARHQAYYEKVRRQFELAEFFRRYPHYPLGDQ